MTSFDELTLEVLRTKSCMKWTYYPELHPERDILPLWVADMDFPPADPIAEALSKRARGGNLGYPAGYLTGEPGLRASLQTWLSTRHGWAVAEENIWPVHGIIPGLYLGALACASAGEGVVMQSPLYPPFMSAVNDTGRVAQYNPVVWTGTRWGLDLAGLEAVITPATRVVMFCNPHNPTGRVFSREELQAIGDLAVERDLVIISDEVHADLVYSGHTHIPMATLSPEIAARTVTLTAASKGFNLAALRCSVIYFGSQELRERFRKSVPDYMVGSTSVVGIEATVAAWYHGQPWLDEVLKRLEANRDFVTATVKEQMPGVHYYPAEGTYLSWLNCDKLGLPGESAYHFFLDEGKVGLNEGETFGTLGKNCVRLNFATSHEVLEQVLGRMADALERTPALTR